MIEIVEYMLERFGNIPLKAPCIVAVDGICCKIKRELYRPDDKGVITFHREMDWLNSSMTVVEMIETLKMYEKITDFIRFETYNGDVEEVVNIMESSSLGNVTTCNINVGDGSKVMEIH